MKFYMHSFVQVCKHGFDGYCGGDAGLQCKAGTYCAMVRNEDDIADGMGVCCNENPGKRFSVWYLICDL